MNDNLTETLTDPDLTGDLDLASGRWEPCHAFSSEVAESQVADSQICGACGWLHDDHREPAVIRHLPVRTRPAAQPRRLAS